MRFVVLVSTCLLVTVPSLAEAKSNRYTAAQTAAEESYGHYLFSRLSASASGAPMRGRSGTVLLVVKISKSGKVKSRHVRKSSGDPYLDALALAIVDRAAPFAPLPAILKEDCEAVTPIVFRGRPIEAW